MANGTTRYYPQPEVVQLIFGESLSRVSARSGQDQLSAIACAVHFLTIHLTRDSLRLILICPALN